METPHSVSSFPESGDSGESLPDDPSAAKIKLMCSYGGRIQFRHDNQLAYVGGETKIIALDRSIRFPAFYARLATLLPAPVPDFLVKYQLPGQNLDVLISVINDDDIDNMIFEYDLLQLPSSPRPAPRLRFFLFPLASPRNPSPPHPDSAPDFLFGLDTVQDAVPPPLPPPVLEKLSSPVKEDRADPVPEIQPQQIPAENQQTAVQRNIIDEVPASKAVPAAEIQQQKAAAVLREDTDETVVYKKAQRPAAYWPSGSRYASMMGEQPVYMIPGPYPAGPYYAAVPTMWPPPSAAAKVSGGAETAGFAVAYDSNGRAVYYTGSVVPAYQTVGSVAPVGNGMEAKPPQVS